jgi:hypothetical protein
MSGYFTRLAQRTGLQPNPARSTPASATGTIEQNVQVEARPAAANEAAGVPPAAFSEAGRSRTVLSDSTLLARKDGAIEKDVTREEPSLLGAARTTERSSIIKSSPAPRPSSVQSLRSRESAPPLPSMEALAAPSEERVEPTEKGTLTQPMEIETERASTNTASERIGAEMVGVESALARETQRRSVSLTAKLAPAPDAGNELPAPGEHAALREAMLDAAHSKTAPASPRPVTVSKARPAGHDIAVHIGAIQLEIHSTAQPPRAQPGPARQEAARESPRFEPRRHYLRC